MGRGLSSSRTFSARNAGKGKRSRSLSMTKLNAKLSASAAVQDANNTSGVAERGKIRVRRVLDEAPKKKATTGSSVAPAPVEVLRPEGENESDLECSEDEAETVRRPDVLTKYKLCGKIVDEVLHLVKEAAVAGANTFHLCQLGNTELHNRIRKVFSNAKGADGKKISRGIAFPTNVSINNVVCHHAPLAERDAIVLKPGDLVKVHLGAHIDGYPATAAVSFLVENQSGGQAEQEKNEKSVDSQKRKHELIQVAKVAAEGAARLLRPGTQNTKVTEFIEKLAKCCDVRGVEAVLSNRSKRWILDGSDCIINWRVVEEEPQQDVSPCTFEPFQIWTLDFAFTTAPTHRMQLSDEPCQIMRRNEIENSVRMRSAEELLEEQRKKFFCFPFHPLQCENPLRARLAMTELKKFDMLDFFPALQSKKNFVTSRWCMTVALTDRKVHILCGDPTRYETSIASVGALTGERKEGGGRGAGMQIEGTSEEGLLELDSEIKELLKLPLTFMGVSGKGQKVAKQRRTE